MMARNLNTVIGTEHLQRPAIVSGYARHIASDRLSMAETYRYFSQADATFNGVGVLSDNITYRVVFNFHISEKNQDYALLPEPSHLEQILFRLSTSSKELVPAWKLNRIYHFAHIAERASAEGDISTYTDTVAQIEAELLTYLGIEAGSRIECTTDSYDVFSEEGHHIMSERELTTPLTFTGNKHRPDNLIILPGHELPLDIYTASRYGEPAPCTSPRLFLTDDYDWQYLIPYTSLKAISRIPSPGQGTSRH